MDTSTILQMTAGVAAFTQIMKWGLKDRLTGLGAVLLVLVVAALFLLVWAWSNGQFVAAQGYNLLMTWVNLCLASAGVFGFTRAGAESVTAIKP